MKPFDIDTIVEPSRRRMQIIGMWPEKSPTVSQNFKKIISLIIIGSFTFFTLMRGILDFIDGNYGHGSFLLCEMLAALHAEFKIWFLHIEKQKFFKIIDALLDSSVTAHEDCFDIYLQKRLVIIKFVCNFQLIACVSAGVMFSLSDFVFEYRSLPRILSIVTSEDNNNLLIYFLSWSYYAIAGLGTGYVIGIYEGLMFTFLSTGVVHFQILRKQISQAVESYPSRLLNMDEIKYYNELVNNLLKECIVRHNVIESYIVSIENKYTNAYLVQLIITLAVTGFVGFSVIFVSPNSFDFVRNIIFFIADLTQLIVLCIPCTEIITQSDMVGYSCYMSNWWQCSPSVCKTLYIMMERTKRPLYLTAGKFTIISLETFMQVLKMSMSYITMLNKMYGED